MNILTLLVVIPILTIIAILFTKDLKGARMVSAVGMGVQLITTAVLVFMYLAERKTGNMHEMLFTADYTWFKSLNILIQNGWLFSLFPQKNRQFKAG